MTTPRAIITYRSGRKPDPVVTVLPLEKETKVTFDPTTGYYTFSGGYLDEAEKKEIEDFRAILDAEKQEELRLIDFANEQLIRQTQFNLTEEANFLNEGRRTSYDVNRAQREAYRQMRQQEIQEKRDAELRAFIKHRSVVKQQRATTALNVSPSQFAANQKLAADRKFIREERERLAKEAEVHFLIEQSREAAEQRHRQHLARTKTSVLIGYPTGQQLDSMDLEMADILAEGI